MFLMKTETIIGLEVHVQLRTKTKMFCGCDNTGEIQPPNTTICEVCTGQPGVLPVPNKQAIAWTVRTALALGCAILHESHFDRKHYYYPDLPKGYQISQLNRPFGSGGTLDLTTRGIPKQIRINRIHLEEDAAKLSHVGDNSAVDFNRSSTPLMEIVTEPDVRSAEEAKVYVQELRLLMLYLGVSDADMEKGHLRCDASISVMPEGQEKLNKRMEIKNLNSFRAIEKSLLYEEKRLKGLLVKNEYPENDATRSWDDDEGVTQQLRDKESSADYRYFPEPDIPPIRHSKKDIDAARADLPEMPWQKRERFEVELGFNRAHALQFTEDKDVAAFVEAVASDLREWLYERDDIEGTKEEIWTNYKTKAAKLIGNWTATEFTKLLKEKKTAIMNCKITPENFAEFLTLIFERKINSSQAQTLLAAMFDRGGEPDALMSELDLGAIEGDALENVYREVIAENGKAVVEYKAGKTNAVQYLVGQVMKRSKGKANPEGAREELEKRLSEDA